MSTLITNIAELTTNVSTGGDRTGTVLDAAVLIEGEPGPPIIDGQPVPTPAPLPGNQPVIRPTSPQPTVKEAPRAEKKADADFF